MPWKRWVVRKPELYRKPATRYITRYVKKLSKEYKIPEPDLEYTFLPYSPEHPIAGMFARLMKGFWIPAAHTEAVFTTSLIVFNQIFLIWWEIDPELTKKVLDHVICNEFAHHIRCYAALPFSARVYYRLPPRVRKLLMPRTDEEEQNWSDIFAWEYSGVSHAEMLKMAKVLEEKRKKLGIRVAW